MNKRQYKKLKRKMLSSMGFDCSYRVVPTVFLDGTISSIFKRFNTVFKDFYN